MAPAQTSPNLAENVEGGVKNLIGFFQQFNLPNRAPTGPAPVAQEKSRSAQAPARSAPAPTRSAPAPAPARPAPSRASGEVPDISPLRQARIFYDNLESEGRGKVDFSFIKSSQGNDLSNHLTKKMNFWTKTLDDKQVNASNISVNSGMRKEEMLLNYAKFLKENIDRTKTLSDNGKEIGKALLTSQEFEMARLLYFVDGLSYFKNPRLAIYEATSEQSRTYASRKDERMPSDPKGIVRENTFITNITPPDKLEPRDIVKPRVNDMRPYLLITLAKNINQVCKNKKSLQSELPQSPSPSPSPSLRSSTSISQASQEKRGGQKSSQEKGERNKLRNAISNIPLPNISGTFNETLIIEESALDKRMNNIEQLLGGSKEQSNAKSKKSESKENSLIDYVDFLSEKIKLVKKTISSDDTTNDQKTISRKSTKNDQKSRLEFLQGEMLREIVKIRVGVFPESKMSDAKKRTEAGNLIEYISSNLVRESLNEKMDQTINTAPKIGGTISQDTLDRLDRQIEKIVNLVNPREKKLDTTVSSGSEQGRDPGKTWAGTQRPDARGPSGGRGY